MNMHRNSSILVLVALTMAIALIGVIMTMLFLYQRRYFGLKTRMEELKAEHAREIEVVQKEIYRQSLDDIAAEIHDDLGQRLSIAKIMISVLRDGNPDDLEARIVELKRVMSDALFGLRNLTQQLRSDYENDISLPEAFQQELNRLKRLGIITTQLSVNGIPKKLDNKTSLFLFRMFQESLNNIVAHARASICSVQLDYTTDHLTLRIDDDGVGFTYPAPASHSVPRQGIGLENIRKRGVLIGAKLTIRTSPGLGTGITIVIPYMNQIPIT